MVPVLLLVDLQNDFLDQLPPGAGTLVSRAASLLNTCRQLGVPVIHARTETGENNPAMPHWGRNGTTLCVRGTEGWRSPAELEPLGMEPVITKTFFSPFTNPDLQRSLAEVGATTVVLAGVHLHGCVRAAALDAYQNGFDVIVAEDATGGYDPVHSATSRQWLEGRAARFMGVDAIDAFLRTGSTAPAELVHTSPWGAREVRWRSPIAGVEECRSAARSARGGLEVLQGLSSGERSEMLGRLADAVEGAHDELVERLAYDIGKPVSYGASEVRRAVDLIRAASRAQVDTVALVEAQVRRRPLGVVAVITAFNNPIAVPLGKIAPALFFGNCVVWKPAPAGTAIASRILELACEAGVPEGVLGRVFGDSATALLLANEPGIDAVTLTGSAAAGTSLQLACVRRSVPFQGELGGNNAAIVWDDADLPATARHLAEGGFGCAGQRCTATRRVVVDERVAGELTAELVKATSELKWGDPLDPGVSVGPLVSIAARDRVSAVVERARRHSHLVCSPHTTAPPKGAYYPPTIVATDAGGEEIVQEETFGPVMVIQRAGSFTEALDRCNGVSQGLAAALFSNSPELQEAFIQKAQAGILKINSSTAGAGTTVPFGGWKTSGVGPPEHGESNKDFYTRTQAVYFSR